MNSCVKKKCHKALIRVIVLAVTASFLCQNVALAVPDSERYTQCAVRCTKHVLAPKSLFSKRQAKARLVSQEEIKLMGSRLKAARLAKELTEIDLGKKVNVNPWVIYMLETGKTEEIDEKKIQKLADALGVSYEYLVKEEEKVIALLPERLQKARLAKNLNQTKLGKKVGIAYSTISHWEQGRGKSVRDTETIQRLADALDVSYEYLVGEEEIEFKKVIVLLPEYLRRARLAKNLNQTKLGEKVGVSISTISKWEQGRGKPVRDTETIQRLADVLDVPYEYLVAEKKIEFKKVIAFWPERLQEARLAKDLSHSELGKEVGESQKTILEWETGKDLVRGTEMIQRLADALDVSYEYLVGEKDIELLGKPLVGSRLQVVRLAKDLSHSELGEKVGESLSTIFKWEAEEEPVRNAETIQRLAGALDVSYEYLVGEEEIEFEKVIALRPERLRRARLEKNSNQTKLGEKAGVSISTIAKWEQGRVKPIRDTEKIQKLANALDVSYEYLVGEEEIEFEKVIVLLPEYLRRARLEKNLNQTELGEKVGVSFPTIARWEQGRGKPVRDTKTIQKLSNALGVSYEYLVGKEEIIELLGKPLVGSRLQVARLAGGLSRTKLEKKVGVSQGMILKWEKGKEPVRDTETIQRLAVVLSVPYEYLVGEKEVELKKVIALLPERLKVARLTKGPTEIELSRNVRVIPWMISRWEDEYDVLNKEEMIRKLANALGVTYEYLVGKEEIELLGKPLAWSRLQAARLAKDLSHSELGKKVGESQKTILEWEAGEEPVRNTETIQILAGALGVTYEYLVGKEEIELLGKPLVWSRLKAARSKKKLTALELGITDHMLYMIERGEISVTSIKTIQKFANALGVPYEDLVGEEDIELGEEEIEFEALKALVSDRLKAARSAINLSQDKLGKKVGEFKNAIWRWENEEGKPLSDTKKIQKLANVLGVSYEYLVGEEEIEFEAVKALVSDRLKAARSAINLTLEKLCKKVEKSQNAIWKWENGKGKPVTDTEMIQKLANALGVSYGYLVGEEDIELLGETSVWNRLAEVQEKIKTLTNQLTDLEKEPLPARGSNLLADKLLKIWPQRNQEDVITALMRRLKDPDKDMRFPAEESLGEIIKIIDTWPQAEREKVITALKEHITALIENLNNPDDDVRESAAESLGKLGEVIKILSQAEQEKVITVLIWKLNDFNDDVGVSVAKSLEKFGKIIDTWPQPAEQKKVITALKEHIAALMGKLNDPDDDVRSSAVESLGRLSEVINTLPRSDKTKVITLLIGKLNDTNREVRIFTAESLKKLNGVIETLPRSKQKDVITVLMNNLGRFGYVNYECRKVIIELLIKLDVPPVKIINELGYITDIGYVMEKSREYQKEKLIKKSLIALKAEEAALEAEITAVRAASAVTPEEGTITASSYEGIADTAELRGLERSLLEEAAVDAKILQAIDELIAEGNERITQGMIAKRIKVNNLKVSDRVSANPAVAKAFKKVNVSKAELNVLKAIKELIAEGKERLTQQMVADKLGLSQSAVQRPISVLVSKDPAVANAFKGLSKAELNVLKAMKELTDEGKERLTQQMVADKLGLSQSAVQRTISVLVSKDLAVANAFKGLSKAELNVLKAIKELIAEGKERLTQQMVADKLGLSQSAVQRPISVLVSKDPAVANAFKKVKVSSKKKSYEGVADTPELCDLMADRFANKDYGVLNDPSGRTLQGKLQTEGDWTAVQVFYKYVLENSVNKKYLEGIEDVPGIEKALRIIAMNDFPITGHHGTGGKGVGVNSAYIDWNVLKTMAAEKEAYAAYFASWLEHEYRERCLEEKHETLIKPEVDPNYIDAFAFMKTVLHRNLKEKYAKLFGEGEAFKPFNYLITKPEFLKDRKEILAFSSDLFSNYQTFAELGVILAETELAKNDKEIWIKIADEAERGKFEALVTKDYKYLKLRVLNQTQYDSKLREAETKKKVIKTAFKKDEELMGSLDIIVPEPREGMTVNAFSVFLAAACQDPAIIKTLGEAETKEVLGYMEKTNYGAPVMPASSDYWNKIQTYKTSAIVLISA